MQSLLDICGTPGIEYTLEMLARQEVVEIVLFVSRQSDALKGYLESSRWKDNVVEEKSSHSIKPRIRVVCSVGAHSSGDALRQLDDMGVLRSETVILVDGLVVGNVSLGAALAGHAQRVKADSNTILTVIATPVVASYPPSLCQRLDMAVDAKDGQLWAYVSGKSQ